MGVRAAAHTASVLTTQRHGRDPGPPPPLPLDPRTLVSKQTRTAGPCLPEHSWGHRKRPARSRLPNAPRARAWPSFLQSPPCQSLGAVGLSPDEAAERLKRLLSGGCRAHHHGLPRKYLIWQELETTCPTDTRLPWFRSGSKQKFLLVKETLLLPDHPPPAWSTPRAHQEHDGIGDRDAKFTARARGLKHKMQGKNSNRDKGPGQRTPGVSAGGRRSGIRSLQDNRGRQLLRRECRGKRRKCLTWVICLKGTIALLPPLAIISNRSTNEGRILAPFPEVRDVCN